MKSKDILSVLSLIDPDEMLGQKETKSKSKLGKFIKIASAAACFCLVLSAGILFLPKMMPQQEDIPPKTDGETTTSDDFIIQPSISGYMWIDMRNRNDKEALVQNFAIEWPWNCREIYNQFGNMVYNGDKFISRVSNLGEEIPTDMIGEKLGEGICSGHDIYTETVHELECEVYEITGVDSNRIVAVKYAGYDAYYPFIRDEYNPPQTFGELASALELNKNVLLDEFYYYTDVINSEKYHLKNGGSKKLWGKILRYTSDAECLDMYEESYHETLISFAINSNALGVHNLSLSLNKQGYLITNIENYGYYYYIGEEAVNDIIALALEYKYEYPSALEPTVYITGVVTEIGEEYIKVNDSILMKDPDSGIEFTVYANHMNIKRYIISGFLKTGATVTVKHEGIWVEPFTDMPTEIKNATDMYEVIITNSGEVLIPE